MSRTLSALWYLQHKIKEGFVLTVKYNKKHYPKWTVVLDHDNGYYKFEGCGPLSALEGLAKEARSNRRRSI